MNFEWIRKENTEKHHSIVYVDDCSVIKDKNGNIPKHILYILAEQVSLEAIDPEKNTYCVQDGHLHFFEEISPKSLHVEGRVLHVTPTNCIVTFEIKGNNTSLLAAGQFTLCKRLHES